MTKHPGRRPYLGNPKAQRRNAKLHRLIKAGTIKPLSKADMRKACDAAVVSKPSAGKVG